MEKKEIWREYKQSDSQPQHDQRHKSGGMHMSFKNELKIGQAFVKIIKQLSGKLIKGDIQNVMALTKPSDVCSQYTFMEVCAFDNVSTQFLDIAAQPGTNALFKMQMALAHTLSGYYQCATKIYNLVPLDPCLGETVQFTKENGTKFYSECIGLHPPVLRQLILGPDNSWSVSTKHLVEARIIPPTLNSLIGIVPATRTYKFSDGTEIILENATMLLEGICVGDRVQNFINTYKAYCKKANIVAEIKFTSSMEGVIKKTLKTLTNFFYKSPEKRPRDDFDIIIYRIMGDENDPDCMKAPISQGGGNWTSHMYFDDKLIWQITDPVEEWQLETNTLLPSDASHRHDKILLSFRDCNTADKVKSKMEQEDQKDVQLRKKYQQKKK